MVVVVVVVVVVVCASLVTHTDRRLFIFRFPIHRRAGYHDAGDESLLYVGLQAARAPMRDRTDTNGLDQHHHRNDTFSTVHGVVVQRVWVGDAHRRRGVATDFLAWLVERAAALGLDYVMLQSTITADSRALAAALVSRHGWQERSGSNGCDFIRFVAAADDPVAATYSSTTAASL